MMGARIYFNSAQAAEKDGAYPNLQLFSYVMERVRKDYVDGQKLTYQDLVYGALKGMLNTLDPHSEFMEPEKYRSEEHTSELQSLRHLVCRLLLEKKNKPPRRNSHARQPRR